MNKNIHLNFFDSGSRVTGLRRRFNKKYSAQMIFEYFIWKTRHVAGLRTRLIKGK